MVAEMRRVVIACLVGAALISGGAVAVTRKAVHAAAKPPVAPADSAAAFLAANARQRGVVQTPSGLQYRVIAPGTGASKPTDDDVALVNYVGKLTNGSVFDQSAQPTPMPIAGVVPGFAEALKAMPKGAKYRVWIKPSLAYGDTASGPIPAHSVLVFDIELLDFISTAQFRALQSSQATPQPGK
jgi:FKBP-type peptidyl-prolyl cis-trans isomerase